MINLKNRVAVITGASRGVGAATAIKFAEAGAHVVINYYHHEEEAERIAGECRAHGVRAITFQADVSKLDDVRALFEAAIHEFGPIDIVVANAGVWTSGAIDQLDEKIWN